MRDDRNGCAGAIRPLQQEEETQMEITGERNSAGPMRGQRFRMFCSRSVAYGAIALGLVMGAPTMHAQGYPPPPYGARAPYGGGPVEQTINDLQGIARANGVYSNRERQRYDNALRHLSEFQDRLRRRRFDKDKLDQAIEDVQNIVDNNRLDRRAKNVLWRDLGALRTMRARYDHR